MAVNIHIKPPLPSRDPQLYGIMESLSIPENQYIANVIIDSTIIIAISIKLIYYTHQKYVYFPEIKKKTEKSLCFANQIITPTIMQFGFRIYH